MPESTKGPSPSSYLSGGLHPYASLDTLGGGPLGVDNRATTPLMPRPSSCRHHGHLPLGGLQPPGAARAGPVRHHLAPEPDPEARGRGPCRPLRPLLRVPARRPAPPRCPDCPVCVCRPSQGGSLSPQTPITRSPPAPCRTPWALLHCHKHRPTDLLLGQEGQAGVPGMSLTPHSPPVV